MTAARSDRPGRRDGGFSLLEALVAIALTGLVLGAAYRSLGLGAQATARAERLIAATTQAENVLARIGPEIPLTPGRQRRDEAGWAALIDIAPHRPEDAALWAKIGVRPYDVAVELRAREASRDAPALVRLETLRLGPADAP